MGKSKREISRDNRRVQVRVRKVGETEAITAYTRNISVDGLFVQTRLPYPPGTPVEVELVYGEITIPMRGQVRHASKIAANLQAVGSSGMGIKLERTDQESDDDETGTDAAPTTQTSAKQTPPNTAPRTGTPQAEAQVANEPDSSERRAAPRASVNTEAIADFGGDKRQVMLRDLSATGAALASEMVLPEGEEVRVLFSFVPNSNLVEVSGVPIRTAKQGFDYLVAIQLVDTPPAILEQIRAFVESQPDEPDQEPGF